MRFVLLQEQGNEHHLFPQVRFDPINVVVAAPRCQFSIFIYIFFILQDVIIVTAIFLLSLSILQQKCTLTLTPLIFLILYGLGNHLFKRNIGIHRHNTAVSSAIQHESLLEKKTKNITRILIDHSISVITSPVIDLKHMANGG